VPIAIGGKLKVEAKSETISSCVIKARTESPQTVSIIITVDYFIFTTMPVWYLQGNGAADSAAAIGL
jgi:hypothetical protein